MILGCSNRQQGSPEAQTHAGDRRHPDTLFHASIPACLPPHHGVDLEVMASGCAVRRNHLGEEIGRLKQHS